MSPTIRAISIILVLFTLDVSVAMAQTVDHWTVVEATGTVELADGAQHALPTQAGTALEPPFTISTGSDGHAVLSHGKDMLTLSADSRLGVPKPSTEDGSLMTQVRQTLGSVLYQVEHLVKPHFEVDTPFLVSVVKGTTFNIHATLEDSTVALIEGKLWVHTPDLTSEVVLAPGQAAIKSRTGQGIIVKDQQALSSLEQGPITVANHGTDGAGEPSASGKGRALSSRNAGSSDTPLSPTTTVGTALHVRAGVGGASKGLGIAVGAASTGITAGSGTLLNVSTSLGGGSALGVSAGVGSTAAGASVGGGGLIDIGATTTVTTSASTAATTTTKSVTQVPAVGGVLGNALK